MAATEGRTVRAVVCDLDDTLWPGCAGEQGAISAGNDWPGNAFLAVQRCLKAFAGRGLLLAIASKNDEAAALAALRSSGMILEEDDFSARRIDWNPKPENIRGIAEELGLAESSILVLDNDPLERAEIRESIPRAVVPELPWDVADWPRFLVNHPLLTQLAVLPEDTRRRTAYRVKRIVEQATPERSRESVLRSLELEVEWKLVDRTTLPRAVQLAAKTNQFNTSSIRYCEGDLERLHAEGDEAWTVRVRDGLGGDEIAGLAVIRFEDGGVAIIETILLSCRVLGRGLETATLAFLSETAKARGCRWLDAGIVETERNRPCRDLYLDHGFEQTAPGWFIRDLMKSPIERPAWFTYL